MAHGQYNLGFNATMSRYRARWIQEFFGSKKIRSILDVGSGPADLLAELDSSSSLIARCPRVTLVDFNKHYLAQAKKRFTKFSTFRYISSPVENLKLSETYDLIIMSGILEHVKNPLRVLQQIKKFLSSKGCIVVMVPNAASLHRRIGRSQKLIRHLRELGDHDRKVGHYRYFDSHTLSTLIRKAGYRIQARKGILLKPFPNSMMEKLSLSYCDALYDIGKELPDYCAEIACVLSKKSLVPRVKR